ncbi:MAG: ABC transporter ATP-binding protein [Magnetococcus sp. WYHC-3]
MIELSGVRKIHHQGHHAEIRALDGIDLLLHRGQVTLFTGPSGSGKTTLLTLVGALARPSEGRITLDGRPLSGLPERFLTPLRRATFGFVFQRFNLIGGLSVLENVMLPALPTGETRQHIQRRAEALLERLELPHLALREVNWLSGGEAQRCAIARALINDPAVILADEPSANLDSALTLRFMQIVADLRSEGRTVIIASHDPLIIGSSVVERCVSLRDGRVVPGKDPAPP